MSEVGAPIEGIRPGFLAPASFRGRHNDAGASLRPCPPIAGIAACFFSPQVAAVSDSASPIMMPSGPRMKQSR
jgi:hypothetical protein